MELDPFFETFDFLSLCRKLVLLWYIWRWIGMRHDTTGYSGMKMESDFDGSEKLDNSLLGKCSTLIWTKWLISQLHCWFFPSIWEMIHLVERWMGVWLFFVRMNLFKIINNLLIMDSLLLANNDIMVPFWYLGLLYIDL